MELLWNLLILPLFTAGERLSPLFLQLANMGITASYIILAVFLFRLFLRKAPRLYSYLLWPAALFRLLCPFGLPSPASILGLLALERNQAVLEYIPPDIGMRQIPQVQTGIPALTRAVSRLLPAGTPMYSANPLQIWIPLFTGLWLLGIAAFAFYTLRCERKLKRLTRAARETQPGVYVCGQLAAPFARGIWARGLFGSSFLQARIYLPAHLDDEERLLVLAHERVHLRRRDPLFKGLFFAALLLHWYNPLVWLAFFFMVRDMEMSCDEAVLLQGKPDGAPLPKNRRVTPKDAGRYSEALLRMAAQEAGLSHPSAFGPLAFGESGVSARVKHILRFHDIPRRLRLMLTAACLAVLLTCACNPASFGQDPAERLDLLWENRTPYIGNASNVGNLLGALTVPEGLSITADGMEIKTAPRPYELIIRYLAEDEDQAALQGQTGWVRQNMILLFGLIGNAELITTRVTFEDGTVYSWTFSRAQAMRRLDRSGIGSALPESRDELAGFVSAVEAGGPLRGLCLGMPDNRSSFSACVAKPADESGLLVQVLEADSYLAHEQLVLLALDENMLIFDVEDQPIAAEELEAGDMVHVSYDGCVQELSPSVLPGVYSITKTAP